jgi:hypothetical protein
MGKDRDINYGNIKKLLKSWELGKKCNMEFNIESSPVL